MLHLLDNVIWHALSGPHRHLAEGSEHAARYQREVTALAAFPDLNAPDFDALRPYCRSGEQIFVLGWNGAAPLGWSTEVEATIVKMAWDAPFPEGKPAFDPVELTAADVVQMQALATATNPGPFGRRTIELGDYVGYRDGGRLVAMAGERMRAGNFREVSAVCTYPEYQGRGFARELMLHLVRRQLRRAERPFLHVLKSNERALRMYDRMGFRVYREMPARIMSLS